MTIRWFTDADRRAMSDAAEERAVLIELEGRYARPGPAPRPVGERELQAMREKRRWPELPPE